jgi:hypothetical protein
MLVMYYQPWALPNATDAATYSQRRRLKLRPEPCHAAAQRKLQGRAVSTDSPFQFFRPKEGGLSACAQGLVWREVHLPDRMFAELILMQISGPGGGLPGDMSRRYQQTVRALQPARPPGAEVHMLIANANVADALST